MEMEFKLMVKREPSNNTIREFKRFCESLSCLLELCTSGICLEDVETDDIKLATTKIDSVYDILSHKGE